MPTSVTSTGITFPDATTQTTAAAASSYVGGRGQVFTSSGTFTVPTGVTSVAVTVQGGGGGGGACNGGQTSVTYGGGGGGGGRALKYVTGLTPGASVTVTVGAAGGSAQAGGTSSFGAYVSATGGAAGQTVNIGQGGSGGAGGSGQSGDINVTGGTGGTAQAGWAAAGGGGGIQTTPIGIFFGNCYGSVFVPAGGFWGGNGGTAQTQNNTSFTGCNASGGYGNGAGGGFRYNGTASGGTGTAGLVIVEY